ncbi:MAG: tRNA preQ1(34) S-adenosylmethionine ribosyltransferase-isomerase QueA [Thermoguttaceae bacterium]|jgi:S-adenosylmethionine:tRNA ribosyltransferase-isomerase
MSELDQYDYALPRHFIAQNPAISRIDARLLVVDRKHNSLDHRYIRDLPEILRAGDCLVLNDTKVIPARLLGYRANTGGKWEGLFLEAAPDKAWRVLSHTRGKLTPGEQIILLNVDGREDIRLILTVKEPDGTWIVRPQSDEDPFAILDRLGRVPLPPYIRDGEMLESDRENYQTVYARLPGSVAAPTAGLHFTESLLRRLKEIGVIIAQLTLHIGLGTFRPITADKISEHRMHAEWGVIEPDAVNIIQTCRQRGGRTIAVGTTSVRLLETAAADGLLKPFRGPTNLFIRPPYRFHAVDAMLTNFHLPRTTLLILVRTFGGDALIKQAYDEAIREQYRFYSYGDAMLIL